MSKGRILSVFMAAVMAVSAINPLSAPIARAQAKTAHVNIYSTYNGEKCLHAPVKGVEVSSDLAESFGFTDTVEGEVSALDVLVKANILYDDEANLSSNLKLTDSGSISKAFGGKMGINFGYAINWKMPLDLKGTYNDSYGFTGLMVNEAPVKDGDTVEFFNIADSYYSDCYPLIKKDSAYLGNGLNVNADEEITLEVAGYGYMFYGALKKPQDYASDMDDSIVAYVMEDGTVCPLYDYVNDDFFYVEDGEVTFSFQDGDELYSAKYLTIVGVSDLLNEDGTYNLILRLLEINPSTLLGMNPENEGISAPPAPEDAPGGDAPAEVLDYLCIDSQYTNNPTYGQNPGQTLDGSGVKSLGNFGGYIGYTFDPPLIDNPKNKYGVDFYVYGNAYSGANFAEPGQVYISEDKLTWYALAGSEHFEEDTDWDYSVNYGGTTLSGVALPSAAGNIHETGDANARETRFGYADVFTNGSIGADVNPYAENINAGTSNYNSSGSNGFDIAWAVDSAGNPVDVTGRQFPYVKIVTASHNVNSVFGEKSTEVSRIVRSTAQAQEVGKTTPISTVSFSDGISRKTTTLPLDKGKVYEVDLDIANPVISVNSGASNIYINNMRGASGKVKLSNVSPRLVRLIAQDGEKEPVSYLLKLKSTADPVNEGPGGGGQLPGGGKIKVRFSLLGDSRHNSDKDGIVHTKKAGNLDTWLSTATYEVNEGASVLELIEEAFRQNGVSKSGSSYISSVTYNGTTLSASSNGKNSGWMYTLNGSYPDRGVADEILSDGDTVVLHYTDDWSKESAAEALGGDALTDEPLPGEFAGVRVKLYRLYNSKTGEHLITTNAAEVSLLKKSGWSEEGSYGFGEGDIGVYRLFNPVSGEHLYTSNAGEAKILNTRYGWLYDNDKKPIFYTGESGELGVYRLYNKSLPAVASHHYTQNATEAKLLVEKYGYEYDNGGKPVFYLFKSGLSGEGALEAVFGLADKKLRSESPQVGSIGGEWMVIGLARSTEGVDESYKNSYYNKALAYVSSHADAEGRLDKNKSTENSRLALALLAIGRNPANIGGKNLLSPLTDISYVKKQGINGLIWALIALDGAKTGASTEEIVAEILREELPGGGFSLIGKAPEPDTTAMAITALAPHIESYKVRDAVDKSLTVLSKMQQEDGGYLSYGASNSESVAQVILALTSLGIDPDTDTRFIKNEKRLTEALYGFAHEEGGFKHKMTDTDANAMATEQCYYALVSYYRLKNGNSGLFGF